MTLQQTGRGGRGAYTLMELLIVIIIMITLVSIALPVAKKVMDDAGPKEASRQLAAFFALAKAKAADSGRPWGVWIECTPQLGGTQAAPTPPVITNVVRQATRFYLAEVPELYTGDVLGATVRLVPHATVSPPYPASYPGGPGPWRLDFGNSGVDGLTLPYLVGQNNEFFIRFGYAGDWFRGFVDVNNLSYIYGPAGRDMMWGSSLVNSYLGPNSDDLRPPMPPVGVYVRFQIVRRPQRVNNTIELTSGTCIDLTYSGMGTTGIDFSGYADGYSFNSANPFRPANTTNDPVSYYSSIVVMFLPGGGLESIHLNPLVETVPPTPVPSATSGVYGQFNPTGALHFLIGKVQKVGFPLATSPSASPTYLQGMYDPEMSNLADPARWLTISRTTGAITTSENVPPQYVSTSATRLTYQNTDVGGASPTQVNIETTKSQRIINAATSLYGRPTFIEMCRTIATGQQQIGGR